MTDRTDDGPPPPTIRLRTRHILCAHGLRASDDIAAMGYGEALVANMARLVHEQLRGPNGANVRIRLTDSADAVCASCPFRVGTGCLMQDRADRTDAAHAEALGVRAGETIRWGACVDRIRERVRPDDLDTICQGCPWLPLGMCKAAVASLRATAPRAGAMA